MTASGDTRVTASPEIARRVRDAQIDLLYSFPQRVVGNAINAALVAGVVWRHIDTLPLVTWLLLHVAVAAARWGLAIPYRRRPAGDDIEKWGRRFFVGSTCTGLLWGAASAAVWLTGDLPVHVFVAFVIAGTISAAAAMSYPMLGTAYVFILCAGAPLAISFLALTGTIHLVMGLMSLLLMALLGGQIRSSHMILLRSLHLREENRSLVRDLSHARDTLEQRVRERTTELNSANESLRHEMTARVEAESRLRQAQKMEALGQLTGGVAHDFNNLLAVIQGNAELLAEHSPGKTASREVRAILRASDRGAQLTQRLLAFARRQTLNPRVINVNELMRAAADMLARTLGSDVSVVFRPGDDVPPARVDPGQLENAVLNLAINARDAMKPGGTLTISTASTYLSGNEKPLSPSHVDDHVAPGRYVVIEVEDTGVGIPGDVLDKVWDPFFTTKGEDEGTGLGLSMVYGFMRQSGGLATIESELGRGTLVRLFLPCDEGMGASPAETDDITGVPGGKETIFVIEDEEDVRIVVEAFLTRLGYHVIAAASAEETYEKLARYGRPDLFLSDVLLPGGNRGPELVASAWRNFGEVPVVFMSGKTSRDFAKPLGEGADITLINKPFELAALARILRRALDGRNR